MAVAATIIYEKTPMSVYDEAIPKLFPGGVHDGAGNLSHWCEQTDTGWIVHDVWESEEAWDAFLNDRLMPIVKPLMEQGGRAPETRVYQLHDYMA